MRVVCALWGRRRVLQRVVCMLGTWVLPRALLSECGVRYETWVLMSLQGVAARVWALGFDGGYVYAGAKKASAFAIWAYAGVVCANRGISLPNQYGKCVV